MKVVEVVAGVALRGDKALLVQRHPHPLASWSEGWCFAGGKVEPGETFSYALAREWREELDAQVLVDDLVHCMVYRTDGYPHPYRVRTFRLRLTGSLQLQRAGGQAVRWVTLSELADLKALNGTVDAFKACLALPRRPQ
jgi:8-oxo-dGTP diphosphatase